MDPPTELIRTQRERSAIAHTAEVLPSASVGHGTRSQQADEDDFLVTLNVVARAIRRWWKISTAVSILLAAGSFFLILHFFTPSYRAVAWIKIDSTTPFIAFEAARTPVKPELFVETQIELLTSPMVLAATLEHPEVANSEDLQQASNPIESLQKKIRVEKVGESELYEVSSEGSNARREAVLINTAVNEYLELRGQDATLQSRQVIELLEVEKDHRNKRIQELRQNIRDLGRDLLIQDPFTASAAEDNPIHDLHEKLTAAEVEAEYLEIQVKAAEKVIKQSGLKSDATALGMGATASEVESLRDTVVRLRLTMQETAENSVHGKDDPSYVRLERELKFYAGELESAMKQATRVERQDELEDLKSKLETSRLFVETLRRRYKQLAAQVGDAGDQSLELEFARSELEREEGVFDRIAERITMLQTELRAPSRVSLVKKATVPLAPIELLPFKELAAALLVSLCLPIGSAIVWERMARRINESKQLEAQGIASVVGEVARLPRRRRSERDLQPAWNLFEESIDSVRTALVLPDGHQQIQVLAICSAVSREGKTSVASQLAVSIAHSTHQPTLLVDGDMRRPDIYQKFGISNNCGLATVLENECPIDEAIDSESHESLHILPAGALHTNPHRLIGNGALGDLLGQLRDRYRFIVIDTPPILGASESLVLAKHADGVVVCAMQDYSRESQTRLACQRIQSVGAVLLGAVLTAVPTTEYAKTHGAYAYQYNGES